MQAGRGFGGYALRTNEERKPVDTLDLDQFLAETNKSEMRAMHSGRPQGGGQTSGQNRGGVGELRVQHCSLSLVVCSMLRAVCMVCAVCSGAIQPINTFNNLYPNPMLILQRQGR